MAANSVADALRSLRQKFNFTEAEPPSSISMGDLLSSPAYLESFPRTFKLDFHGPPKMEPTDVYRIVHAFVSRHNDNTELGQILLPLFCYTLVQLRREKAPPEVAQKFTDDYIATIPECEKESAIDFTTNEATFLRLASLFCTQRSILRFTPKTKELVLKFLNKETNSKVRATFMDVFEIWEVKKEVKYEAIIDRFTGSLSRGVSIMKGRVRGATHARFSKTAPEMFCVIDGSKVVRMSFAENTSQDIAMHADTITTMGLSSQSRVVMTADVGANVNLWSSSASVRFKAGLYPVWCSDFASHGGVFALGSGDGFVKLCSCETQQQFRAFSGDPVPVVGVKFHPNCAYVASVADKRVRLWDVRKGENVRLFFMETSACGELAFSPNGEYLACFDGGVSVFNIGKNELVARKPTDIANLIGLGFAENSKTLFLVAADGRVDAVDIENEGAPVQHVTALNEPVISCETYLNELRIVTTY